MDLFATHLTQLITDVSWQCKLWYLITE